MQFISGHQTSWKEDRPRCLSLPALPYVHLLHLLLELHVVLLQLVVPDLQVGDDVLGGGDLPAHDAQLVLAVALDLLALLLLLERRLLELAELVLVVLVQAAQEEAVTLHLVEDVEDLAVLLLGGEDPLAVLGVLEGAVEDAEAALADLGGGAGGRRGVLEDVLALAEGVVDLAEVEALALVEVGEAGEVLLVLLPEEAGLGAGGVVALGLEGPEFLFVFGLHFEPFSFFSN